MVSDEAKKFVSKEVPHKSRAAEIANTFEWLITAFILAFVFRAFVMEAFHIPTGSMADTLKGAHFRLRCQQCGYEYDYGFVPERYGMKSGTTNHKYVPPVLSRCPSCGHHQPTGGKMPIANGDRVLVLKCLYQFIEPKRWDVVVFKNPLEPSINYIKRLIGKPGETIEIIDGDIYIDGNICRKPPKVQNEMWMPIYDNDHQPVRPNERLFNGHAWQQPFKNIENSNWNINKDNPTLFYLDSNSNQINTLIYDSSIGNDLRVTYAYNNIRDFKFMPYCSDVMVKFYADRTDYAGTAGIELSKYENSYRASIDFSGEMVIEKISPNETTELTHKKIDVSEMPDGKIPTLVKFANVDHKLVFQFGSEELTFDLGTAANDAGEMKTKIEPQVKIFGSGTLTLSHIAVFRDIHYTAQKSANSNEIGRATQGNPLALKADEFFMLGDNSPSSEDGRWWVKEGKGNNEKSYRPGVVPREYLVGKAFLVYWPSGFKPFAKSPFAIIPNIGKMRFVYGGSAKQ